MAPMSAAEAMAAKIHTAGLVREAIHARAKTKADALAELVAWREVDRHGYDTEEWWAATYRLRDIADRLVDDRDGIRATVRTAQAIVRGELPCGHSIFDACEACVPGGAL